MRRLACLCTGTVASVYLQQASKLLSNPNPRCTRPRVRTFPSVNKKAAKSPYTSDALCTSTTAPHRLTSPRSEPRPTPTQTRQGFSFRADRLCYDKSLTSTRHDPIRHASNQELYVFIHERLHVRASTAPCIRRPWIIQASRLYPSLSTSGRRGHALRPRNTVLLRRFLTSTSTGSTPTTSTRALDFVKLRHDSARC